MQEDLINAFSEQMKSQYQPWMQLNALWLSNLEKVRFRAGQKSN